MNEDSTRQSPINCQEVIEILSSYVDKELPPADARAIEAHMEGCPKCERFLRSLQTTVGWTRRMKTTRVPREVADRLRAFLVSKIDASQE